VRIALSPTATDAAAPAAAAAAAIVVAAAVAVAGSVVSCRVSFVSYN